MSTYTHDSKACLDIPPVQHDYTPQGKQTHIAGLDCYEVGAGDHVILGIYDIFGYANQTKQGADVLAALGFNVYIPDLFRGKPLSAEDMGSPNRAELIGKFFETTGSPADRGAELMKLVKELKASGKKSVGLYGLCWGGKVVTLLGSDTDASELAGVVSIHPGKVDANDFKILKIPIAFFPSKDEPLDEVEKSWAEIQKLPIASKSVYKLYSTMFHGFAGARAQLDNPENVKEWTDVYGRVGHFFRTLSQT